jgi:hypothetical protein
VWRRKICCRIACCRWLNWIGNGDGPDILILDMLLPLNSNLS